MPRFKINPSEKALRFYYNIIKENLRSIKKPHLVDEAFSIEDFNIIF